MSRITWYRIIVIVLILITLIHGYWFLALPLAVVAGWIFPYFFELILAGIIFDSLYGYQNGTGIYGYLGSIIAVVAYIMVSGAKKVIKT